MISSHTFITGAELGYQLFVGDEPCTERFIPAVNSNWRAEKPNAGLWTSSYVDGISDWVRWCRATYFASVNTDSWWVLHADPHARVLVIDSRDDLDALVAWASRPKLYPMPSQAILLDFEKMRDAGYAGLHLTHDGLSANRYRDSEPEDINGIGFSSWDVESTVWFDWAFTHVAEVKRI